MRNANTPAIEQGTGNINLQELRGKTASEVAPVVERGRLTLDPFLMTAVANPATEAKAEKTEFKVKSKKPKRQNPFNAKPDLVGEAIDRLAIGAGNIIPFAVEALTILPKEIWEYWNKFRKEVERDGEYAASIKTEPKRILMETWFIVKNSIKFLWKTFWSASITVGTPLAAGATGFGIGILTKENLKNLDKREKEMLFGE